jgi:hypothetical protein
MVTPPPPLERRRASLRKASPVINPELIIIIAIGSHPDGTKRTRQMRVTGSVRL